MAREDRHTCRDDSRGWGIEFPPGPASPSSGCNVDVDVCSITCSLLAGSASASKSLESAIWSGCIRTTSGDLALAVRCVVDDDDRGGSGPAIGADAGGGANGEGETDADVDATPRPTGGGAGTIGYFDAVVVAGATTGAAITNCDLDV